MRTLKSPNQAQIGLKIEQKIGYHAGESRRIDRQNGGDGASRSSVAGQMFHNLLRGIDREMTEWLKTGDKQRCHTRS